MNEWMFIILFSTRAIINESKCLSEWKWMHMPLRRVRGSRSQKVRPQSRGWKARIPTTGKMVKLKKIKSTQVYLFASKLEEISHLLGISWLDFTSFVALVYGFIYLAMTCILREDINNYINSVLSFSLCNYLHLQFHYDK